MIGLALCWAVLTGASQLGSFDHSRPTFEHSSRHQSLQLPKRLDVARSDAPANIRNSRSGSTALARFALDGGKSCVSTEVDAQSHQQTASVQSRPTAVSSLGSPFKRTNQPRAPPRFRLA